MSSRIKLNYGTYQNRKTTYINTGFFFIFIIHNYINFNPYSIIQLIKS